TNLLGGNSGARRRARLPDERATRRGNPGDRGDTNLVARTNPRRDSPGGRRGRIRSIRYLRSAVVPRDVGSAWYGVPAELFRRRQSRTLRYNALQRCSRDLVLRPDSDGWSDAVDDIHAGAAMADRT